MWGMQQHPVINLSTTIVAVLTLVIAVRDKIDKTASDDKHAELLKQFAKSGGNTAGIDLAHIRSYLNRTQAPSLPGVGGLGFGQLKEKDRPPLPTRSLPSKGMRPSPTTRRAEPESVIGPVPARFQPKPTCQLKATDIFIVVDNTASGSAIVEHNTFRFLRNMFGKMDVRPNGIRVALDTGGRQINRRLTPSACLDIRCVYEFLHTFVRDTNPERARFRNQTGLNLQPIIYDPLQAITNVYMYNQMTMFSGRTKVLLFLTYGKFQGTEAKLELIDTTLFNVEPMKKVSMFLSLDLKEIYRYEKSFNPVWRPRVSRLKLMTEAEYWANRLCQFLKTGQDQVTVTPKTSSQECTFSEVSRGCKMGLMSCSEIIDQIPEDPQNCKAPPPREEVCPQVEECMHNCDVSTTPWTNWTCFAACEDSDDEHQPRRYRNRQLLVGVEPMACLLFETEEGCQGLLPPCPDANMKSRNFRPPIEEIQEAVKCRYTTSKICRYTHPGICNGVEARRSSTRTTNCPARHKHVNCEPYECDEDCDKRTTPWSQWSSCPACVPADVARPPIATRDRRLVREEEVYCVTKQGRLCSKLPLCRDIGDDDSVSHQETLIHLEQEMELSVGRPEEQASSFTHTSRYTTVTVIIVVLALLVLIVTVGMAVALYFLRESDVNTINAEL